VQIYFFINNYN